MAPEVGEAPRDRKEWGRRAAGTRAAARSRAAGDRPPAAAGSRIRVAAPPTGAAAAARRARSGRSAVAGAHVAHDGRRERDAAEDPAVGHVLAARVVGDGLIGLRACGRLDEDAGHPRREDRVDDRPAHAARAREVGHLLVVRGRAVDEQQRAPARGREDERERRRDEAAGQALRGEASLHVGHDTSRSRPAARYSGPPASSLQNRRSRATASGGGGAPAGDFRRRRPARSARRGRTGWSPATRAAPPMAPSRRRPWPAAPGPRSGCGHGSRGKRLHGAQRLQRASGSPSAR